MYAIRSYYGAPCAGPDDGFRRRRILARESVDGLVRGARGTAHALSAGTGRKGPLPKQMDRLKDNVSSEANAAPSGRESAYTPAMRDATEAELALFAQGAPVQDLV